METGTIALKDVIGWLISLIPLLLFYFEYQTSKKQSKRKLGELEKMLIKEIVARKDLEKQKVEEDLKWTRTLYSHAKEDSERYRQEAEKLNNIVNKLRFKLARNGIAEEEIDLDETSFSEWEKAWEKNKKSPQ